MQKKYYNTIGMIVRKARLKDIESLLVLYKQLMAMHWDYDVLYRIQPRAVSDYRKFIKICMKDPQSLILVAEKKGEIAGFITARILDRFSVFKIKKAAYIYDIFIKKTYRGKKVGKNLIDKFRLWAKRKKIKYIKLEVSPKNKKGLKFWESLGFYVFQHKMALKI
ncbi:MAG: GNAT family N-acetyltransferase [bacterium]